MDTATAPILSSASERSSVPPADLLPVQRKATLGYRIGRALIGPMLRSLFRFRVTGVENLPKGPYVLIANHLNWLDSFALLLCLPPEPRIHFLGDPAILCKRPFQWWVVRKVGGYIPVDRSKHGDPALFHHVDRCLERGGVVALYPEGEYGTKEGEIIPFKKGFAHFALTNEVPVLPVALSGCKDLWLRKAISVTVGKPIESSGHTVGSLVVEGEEQLTALLPPYRERQSLKLFRRKLTGLF